MPSQAGFEAHLRGSHFPCWEMMCIPHDTHLMTTKEREQNVEVYVDREEVRDSEGTIKVFFEITGELHDCQHIVVILKINGDIKNHLHYSKEEILALPPGFQFLAYQDEALGGANPVDSTPLCLSKDGTETSIQLSIWWARIFTEDSFAITNRDNVTLRQVVTLGTALGSKKSYAVGVDHRARLIELDRPYPMKSFTWHVKSRTSLEQLLVIPRDTPAGMKILPYLKLTKDLEGEVKTLAGLENIDKLAFEHLGGNLSASLEMHESIRAKVHIRTLRVMNAVIDTNDYAAASRELANDDSMDDTDVDQSLNRMIEACAAKTAIKLDNMSVQRLVSLCQQQTGRETVSNLPLNVIRMLATKRIFEKNYLVAKVHVLMVLAKTAIKLQTKELQDGSILEDDEGAGRKTDANTKLPNDSLETATLPEQDNKKRRINSEDGPGVSVGEPVAKSPQV